MTKFIKIIIDSNKNMPKILLIFIMVFVITKFSVKCDLESKFILFEINFVKFFLEKTLFVNNIIDYVIKKIMTTFHQKPIPDFKTKHFLIKNIFLTNMSSLYRSCDIQMKRNKTKKYLTYHGCLIATNLNFVGTFQMSNFLIHIKLPVKMKLSEIEIVLSLKVDVQKYAHLKTFKITKFGKIIFNFKNDHKRLEIFLNYIANVKLAKKKLKNFLEILLKKKVNEAIMHFHVV